MYIYCDQCHKDNAKGAVIGKASRDGPTLDGGPKLGLKGEEPVVRSCEAEDQISEGPVGSSHGGPRGESSLSCSRN